VGGRPSSELLRLWTQVGETAWKDPATGLQVQLVVEDFPEHDAVEWYLTFENTGADDSELVENVRVLDAHWAVAPRAHAQPDVVLGRSRGSDFEYQQDRILPGETVTMSAGAGRPSRLWLPFFNLDFGGHGHMVAIGWSGQWRAQLDHAADGHLHMTAGMERLSTFLRPGEKFRTPRIMQLDWSGDLLTAHNKLRRFLLEHHTPRVEGAPISGPFSMGLWGAVSTTGMLDRIAKFAEEGVRQEYLWVDAGWYGQDSSYSPNEFEGDWYEYTGDWSVNPTRHPDGLLPIRDAAANAGMKFLLWAEPGRAIDTTPLVQDHPDWYLGTEKNRLLDFGNPSAREGIADLFSVLIADNKVDLFREDYNIDPLPFWQAEDEPDRVGLAEALYVEGFYWFWDELRRRHPTLIIDNCASGGRRIELETIGRSVALWRSDFQCYRDADPAGSRSQMMGLAMWLPMHGTGLWSSITESISTYRVRSAYGPALQMSAFVRDDQPLDPSYPWELFRRLSDEYLRLRPYYLGDFYPLTGLRAFSEQSFTAYQLDRSDLDGGAVLAFRGANSPWDSARVRLHGIDESARYLLENTDVSGTTVVSGRELAGGVDIRLEDPESSAVVFYTRLT
jgi:alpha-galactosidase